VSDARPSWSPPAEFEEYRVLRALGAGAMGQVFLAHDTLLDRAVAIKFVGAHVVTGVARERFFTEARAVARLSHPNVVAVHRVGELHQRPYLVSEYVRGTPLSAIAKPVPWERALRIALGMARGLASAHRRGVLHRDIKPANVVLGDDDDAKLLDFGLAKLLDARAEGAEGAGEGGVDGARTEALPLRAGADLAATTSLAGAGANGSAVSTSAVAAATASPSALTIDGAIIGTPMYLAPELWRGGAAASRRSDLYSLGVVLYELLAGAPPHARLSFAELSERVGREPAPPIAAAVPGLPPRLAELVDACVAVDPARRPDSADALCELLDGVVHRADPTVDGSPYRGLHTFEPEHKGVFFGRAEETRAVVERLRTETFVVVAGDSGVGKSSLCRATVIPAVLEKSLAGRRWRTATMVPGSRPMARLEAALATRAADEGLLLFVDQLEELLTVADAGEAERVAERLAELVVSSSSVRVLASARGDFLGRLAALPALGELVGRALFLLGPLSERGLRDAIVGPARALGYELASPQMIELLVASGRRHLPLLQFTLAELWDARDDATRTIPADALDRIGGVAGALARRADQVMAALGDADREIAWRVLVRLTTAEGTRAVMTRGQLGEVVGDRVAVERVVERLVSARLLAVSTGGDDRVEVVHEALFTGWPQLAEWRRAHEDGARMRDQHAEAARRWHERGRPRGLLWRGDALVEYRAWRRKWHEPPTALEAAFAAASEADARRARRRWITALAVVLVALSVGLVILYRSDRRATAERDAAERQRRTLLVERGAGELEAGHSARALPYLVAALRAGEDTPAMRVLVAEAMRPIDREVLSVKDMTAGLAGFAWDATGERFAAVGMDGAVRVYRRDGAVLASGEFGADPTQNLPTTDVAFSVDGTRLVFMTSLQRAIIWEPGTDARWEVPGSASQLRLSPDGRDLLVSAPDGIAVWDSARRGRRLLVPGRCADFAPDGRTIAIVRDATAVDLVDAATGAVVRTASALGTGEVARCRVRFTSDGTRLVTGTTTLRLWDATTLAPIADLVAPVEAFDVSPDGGRVIATNADSVRVWDARDGRLLATLPQYGSEGFVHLARGGVRALVGRWGDRVHRVWNVDEGLVEETFEAVTTSPTAPHSTANTLDARFSPDGAHLLSGTGNILSLHRTGRHPVRAELRARSATSARITADGRRVVVGGHAAGNVEIWDVTTGTRVLDAAVGAELWDVGWNAAEDTVLFAGKQGALGVLDAATGAERRLVGHDPVATVNRAAWSPDGRFIASGSDDTTARIWDVASGQPIAVLAHPSRVMCTSWSPDGARVATAGWEGGLRVWNAATGTLEREVTDPVLHFLDVAYSPDGTRLLASSHSGISAIYDLASGERTLAFVGHTGSVTTAMWSPDGVFVATSGIDSSIRIWDAATGRQVAQRHVRGEALQVSWTADGAAVVGAGGPGLVRIWPVERDERSVDALAAQVAARVPWTLVDGRLALAR
jgi:WD40 repeat protein/serine/threonine protein kinase